VYVKLKGVEESGTENAKRKDSNVHKSPAFKQANRSLNGVNFAFQLSRETNSMVTVCIREYNSLYSRIQQLVFENKIREIDILAKQFTD